MVNREKFRVTRGRPFERNKKQVINGGEQNNNDQTLRSDITRRLTTNIENRQMNQE